MSKVPETALYFSIDAIVCKFWFPLLRREGVMNKRMRKVFQREVARFSDVRRSV